MKVTGNVKYIPAGTTQYIVDGSDGEINVDTSLSAITIILPNIINSGYTNSDKGFIINDISGNAATNNITITAINNTVNSQSSILISSNGGTAKCSIASMNEWFAVTEPSTGGMSGNLTPNYIPKAATSSTLNNSIIYQNGTRIGIGTINPLTNFHVSGTNASSIILSTRYSSDSASSGFIAAKARGTEAAPSGILLGDKMLNVSAYGYTSAGAFSPEVGKMVYYAKEDFTASANGTAFKLSTTPIGATVDVFNFGISSNGDVSIGDINLSPTARLHVTGVSATSSDFAFKADNLAASPLLYVRNDSFIGIGTASSSSISPHVQVHSTSAFNYIQFTGSSSSRGLFINSDSDEYSDGFFKVAANSASYAGSFFEPSGKAAVIRIAQNDGVSIMDFHQYTANGKIYITSNATFTANIPNNPSIVVDGQKSGFGLVSPTATIHAKGIDSTSANFALKVDNSLGNPLLYVRNDGLISAALLQTGNAGLTTGDMYVDTAANILANGDKVVGWKV